MSFLTGKKKWLAFIIAVLVNGLNDVLGLGLSAQTLDATNYISGGYIAIEAILDLTRVLSERFGKKEKETGGPVDAKYTIDESTHV